MGRISEAGVHGRGRPALYECRMRAAAEAGRPDVLCETLGPYTEREAGSQGRGSIERGGRSPNGNEHKKDQSSSTASHIYFKWEREMTRGKEAQKPVKAWVLEPLHRKESLPELSWLFRQTRTADVTRPARGKIVRIFADVEHRGHACWRS